MNAKENISSLLKTISFAEMPKGEQIEAVRSLKSVVDDLLYETVEDITLFEREKDLRTDDGRPTIAKGGFSFAGSVNGISIEVLDYHVRSSFLSFEEIDNLKCELQVMGGTDAE